MKLNLIIYSILYVFLVSAYSYSNAEYINFEDVRLEIILVANPEINVNGDSHIQLSEAKTVKQLNVSNMKITNLKGLEFFSELEQLNCSHNQLEFVDLSNNTNLKS